MSSDPRLVPMDLFLQDQRRQDDDIRESRASLERAVTTVTNELRGLRMDTVKAAEQLRTETAAQQRALTEALDTLAAKEADRAEAEETRAQKDFSRREKFFALCLVAGPLLYSFVMRFF